MSEITVVQLGELIAQAKAGRVTRELLQVFLRNPQSVNGQPSKYTVTVYTVTVDYGKTVEEMVSAGRYDRKNDNITTKNFPVNGTGVVTVALELVHLDLDKWASSEVVLAHLEANGMRPATLAELLAFGATYPGVQREFPVVCLDKWVDPDGGRYAPCLGWNGSERSLFFGWFDYGWLGISRFLAVRK